MQYRDNMGFKYTQSPGGVRRGPIWQSGDDGESPGPHYDNRNQVFTNWPYYVTADNPHAFIRELPGYAPNASDDLHVLPSTFKKPSDTPGIDHILLHWTKFVDNVRVPMHNPEYDTVMKQLGATNIYDEDTYSCNIDMTISPAQCRLGMEDFPCSNNLQYDGNGQNAHIVRNDTWQINQNPMGSRNQCYYQINDPEYFPSHYEPVQRILTSKRYGMAPCPFRIKGKLFFSDFPIASLNDPGAGYQYSFNTINQWFLDQMDAYTPPEFNFIGSACQNNNTSDYYDKFKIPVMDRTNDVFTQIPSSWTNNYKGFYMTRGCVYESSDRQFQMFFSPIIVPMVSTNFPLADHDCYSDGMCVITGDTEHQNQYNTNLFFRHATPGFAMPLLRMPRLGSYNIFYDYATQNERNQSTFNRQYMLLQNRNVTNNNIRSPFYCGVPNDNAYSSYLRRSIAGAVGIDFRSISGTLTAPMHLGSVDRNLGSGPTGGATISDQVGNLNAFLQPELVYHEKYVQPVDVAIAQCYIHRWSGYVSKPTGGYEDGISLRHKFCGFKGAISWFETGY